MSDGPISALPTFDRIRDLPRLEQVAGDLAAVEAALAHLDGDTYGRCTVCGEQIPDHLLAAAPALQDCGGHGT